MSMVDFDENDFVEMIYPPEKEDEICELFSAFEIDTDTFEDEGEPKSQWVRLTVRNPYGGSDLIISLEDYFTVQFAGYIDAFFATSEDYIRFLSVVIALLTARKGSLYIMEEQSYALLWEGKLPENSNELGIEANPQGGVYLSLEYFDPRKNQTGYLSGEQP